MSDLKEITLGMALDYQTDYVEVRTKKEDKTRKAKQADLDNF